MIAERASRAPDRRLELSPLRTPTPRKNKITIAVSALGAAAAAAGVIIVCSAGAAAQPAASSRQAQFLSPALTSAAPGHTNRLAPGQDKASLDTVAAVLTAKPASYFKVKPHRAKKHKARRLTPKQIARGMLRSFRWRGWQFKYLNLLWSRESSWNVFAENPYSGAYGIPQAEPGSKMSSAGPDWQRSARTQIRWGLRYIKRTYGSPLAAWQHELATGWY